MHGVLWIHEMLILTLPLPTSKAVWKWTIFRIIQINQFLLTLNNSISPVEQWVTQKDAQDIKDSNCGSKRILVFYIPHCTVCHMIKNGNLKVQYLLNTDDKTTLLSQALLGHKTNIWILMEKLGLFCIKIIFKTY